MQNESAHLQEMIFTGCGLLPFARIEDIPGTRDWRFITGEIDTPALPETDIYELEWSGKGPMGREIPHKWRCYLDRDKNLPLRIERYAFDDLTGDYELETIITADYPERDAFEAVAAQVISTP